MRKLLALAALLALSAPAFAADNTLLVTPCASGCITTKSKDVGTGVQAPQPILSDTSGNPLTTAAAGADGVSNSVNGVDVWAFPMLWNGTTWDRWKGDATNGAFVNIKTSVAITADQGSANATPWLVTGTGGTFPSTVADGANVALGAKADAAAGTGTVTAMAILKQLHLDMTAAIPTQATSIPIGGVTNDPCQYQTKVPFTLGSSTGTTQIVAPSGSTQVYICSFSLIAAATAVVNVVGGTGAACTTGTPVAMFGSTTAASGASLAANGGMTFGNGGATVMRTTTGGHGVCVIQSGTTALAGGGTYVQQ